MARRRAFAILLGVGAAAVAVARHVGTAAALHRSRTAPGGILVGDAVTYDTLSALLLGSLFGGIAADIAAAAPAGARVLEVGCGPGHLSIRLARDHRLDVTGIDLDPAMIERAGANADRAAADDARVPTFLIGDVASLPFPEGSLDLVVSTLSMHHWTDPTAGLAEIGRVLRPGARALIWDFRPGIVPFHAHIPDPLEHTHGTPLRLVSATPWRWPWKLSLAQRIELVRIEDAPARPEP